ncbi:MAG TPA: OsmC family protein [Pseudomonadales bacterium]|nr:OsmC family protein [Pseudomonadales bacterium]
MHSFEISIHWNPSPRKKGGYTRDHILSTGNAEIIHGSAAKQFHGNPDSWNPEQLLISAVAQCHMLTFLFLANRSKIRIASYTDTATGSIRMDKDGIGGEFEVINLYPTTTVACKVAERENILEQLMHLDKDVSKYCFIRRSILTPVESKLVVNWSD